MILRHEPTANAHDTTSNDLLLGSIVVVVKMSGDDTRGERHRHCALPLLMLGGVAAYNIESSPPTYEGATAA